MADFPALPLWTDAYLADTHPDLTLEQHGCYLMLLMASWRRPGCSLPDDDAWFCRWLGVHGNKWKGLRATVLERFFTQDEVGFWTQKRLRKERDFVEKTRRNRSESGKKGMANRWHSNDLASNSVITPTPTPTPIKKEREEEPTRVTLSASPTRARGTRLSPDWHPSPDQIAYAERLGLNVQRTEADFRDYWCSKAGQAALKTDWDRTWQRWCRTEADRQARNHQRGNGHARPQRPDIFDAARRVLSIIEPDHESPDSPETRDYLPRLVHG